MSRNLSSSTKRCLPRAPTIAPACERWASETSGVAVQTVIPSPTWAGVFGIVRTMAACRSPAAIDEIVAPATIDTASAPGRTRP